jgi:hypothetical protein
MSSGMWHCVTGWLLLGILNEHSVFTLKGEAVHKNVLESWNFIIWSFMKISLINPKLLHADKHSKSTRMLCILFVMPVAKKVHNSANMLQDSLMTNPLCNFVSLTLSPWKRILSLSVLQGWQQYVSSLVRITTECKQRLAIWMTHIIKITWNLTSTG